MPMLNKSVHYAKAVCCLRRTTRRAQTVAIECGVARLVARRCNGQAGSPIIFILLSFTGQCQARKRFAAPPRLLNSSFSEMVCFLGNCYANPVIAVGCFANCHAKFICIPRNVAGFATGFKCSMFAFEEQSRLPTIEIDALAFLRALKRICFTGGFDLVSGRPCSGISLLFFRTQRVFIS
jgi:hypothetical protein